MTHSEQILEHLKSGKTITSLEALQEYGCLRLSARIYDLKARGHRIDSQMIDLPNGKRCKEYRLEGKSDA